MRNNMISSEEFYFQFLLLCTYLGRIGQNSIHRNISKLHYNPQIIIKQLMIELKVKKENVFAKK